MNRWLIMGGVVAAGLAVALSRVKVSREVVIAASAYDVGQQISDTGNWKSWRPGIGGAGIESRTPASVVYGGGQTLELAPAGDDRHTRVRWTAKAGVGGWFSMGAALARLKEMLEDPAEYYGFSISIQPVRDTLMLSKKVWVRPDRIEVQREQLLNGLRAYLRSGVGLEGAEYFFVSVDRSISEDSVLLSVGIPVSGRAVSAPGFEFLRLPAAGRLLVGSYEGPYSRMGLLRKVMEGYIRENRLSKVAEPFEKWSDGQFALEYGVY
ncbi:MAG: hypothetical protein JST42_13570 [Bacteroidetes bacterium]|nr:hypothetical protein [Bacteroidota bacterium]